MRERESEKGKYGDREREIEREGEEWFHQAPALAVIEKRNCFQRF